MALAVIGAGYGRTGTASLKLALERLGFGPCHHMTEVLPDPARIALWTRIGAGEALWDQAFAGYRATVDWPACTHWRALAAHYPSAKVILSRRDPEKWFESVNATILNPRACEALAKTPMGVMLERNIWRLFDGRLDDRKLLIERFERHNAAVVKGAAKERLLVFEASDGWGPLCKFLGARAPEEPFPHVNTKEETAKVMEMLIGKLDADVSRASEQLSERMYRGRAAQ